MEIGAGVKPDPLRTLVRNRRAARHSDHHSGRPGRVIVCHRHLGRWTKRMGDRHLILQIILPCGAGCRKHRDNLLPLACFGIACFFCLECPTFWSIVCLDQPRNSSHPEDASTAFPGPTLIPLLDLMRTKGEKVMIWPNGVTARFVSFSFPARRLFLEPKERLELSTPRLRSGCSTVELLRPEERLYQGRQLVQGFASCFLFGVPR